MHAGEKGCEVKPDCQSKPFLTLCRQKVQLIAHNSGIQGRKQAACSTCAYSEMKRKNKSVLTSSAATGSKQLHVRKSAVVLSSLQSQTAEPSRPHFSSSQLLDNCSPPGPTPSSPPHLPLLLGQK